MVDNLQDYYSIAQALVAAVDAEISLLVLALGLLYCFVGISSLRTREIERDSQDELVELRREVEDLSRKVRDLSAQVYAPRATIPETKPEGEEKETAPAPGVATPPPFRAVESEREEHVSKPPTPPLPVAEKVALETSSIAKGMTKSRTSFLGKLKNLFTGKSSMELSSLDDLEEMLITSDVGARVAESLVRSVREAVSGNKDVSEAALKDLLKSGIQKELIPVESDHRLYQPVGAPLVVLVVGVNGVGKTTTVAKLATRYKEQGKKVIAIAADTFRAAAVQQLNEWGTRSGFTVYSGAENAKPAAVVFDGMVAAKEQGADVVLIDTAGRLHTKSNLMQELEGVRNSIKRHVPDAPHETVLVVDGVSGQNALSQAREFNASTPLTGLIVTKLDGTPKGGIIVAISRELKIPVLYVGVGEKARDLLPFSVEEFTQALLSDDGESAASVSSRASSHGGDESAAQM